MFIHTEVYGSGEPLVLIHGWAMHTGIWRVFAKQLAEHYQVICVDLPGHGHSKKIPLFTLESISTQLEKVLPAACSLVGWSLGGMVALDLANRFPERVKNVVMIGSNPCFVKTPTWAGIKQTVLEKFAAELIFDCPGTLLRFLSLQVSGLQHYKRVLKELKTALQACESPEIAVLQGGLAILQHQDLRPQLSLLQCRVQVILGTYDTLVPVIVGEQIFGLNSNIQINIIDKAGHVPFLSHPEQLLLLLRAFLEDANAD